MKQAVLSLSGGMDSSTLLLHLLSNNYKVTCLSFDYGQKHRVELERAQQLVDYLNDKGKKTKNPNIKHDITYQVIKLDGLSELLNSSLVDGGDEVPEGHYEEDNMKSTVVPNRNKIFSSIIQSVALSIANETKYTAFISLDIHAGDHQIYPDCRQEFRDADDIAFQMGNWDAHRVKYYTPYLRGDKFDILKDGVKCCEKLGIDFDEVYKRTNTSYKPIPIYREVTICKRGQMATSTRIDYLSDYKSASSVERIEAFLKLGRKDPVEYANENGPVEWEVTKEHVETLLKEHTK